MAGLVQLQKRILRQVGSLAAADRERTVVPVDQGSRPVIELLEGHTVARLIAAHQVSQASDRPLRNSFESRAW